MPLIFLSLGIPGHFLILSTNMFFNYSEVQPGTSFRS